MRTQFNTNTALMTTITEPSIARGSSVRWFVPLATQQMTVDEWLTWVGEQEATRKDGTTYPAIYSIIGAGPYAASEVTRAIWAANKIGKLPYAKAVHQAEAFRALVDSITHAFGAKLNRAVPEVPAASVSIKTEQQDAGTTRNMAEEIDEAIEDMRQRLLEGLIDDATFEANVGALLAIEEDDRWASEMKGNAVTSSDSGRPAEDEGRVTTAIHAVADIWNYAAHDILFSEASLVEAVHTFDKVDLPIDDPEWQEWVLNRLADSWAARLEYIDDNTLKAKEEKKIAYRAAVAEGGILANPLKARWAVNHVTRRIWRDMQALKDRIAGYDERIARIGEAMAVEERFNKPARMTRIIGETPTHMNEDGTPRQHYLVWEVIDEQDFAPEVEYHDGRSVKRLSQGEYDILTFENIKTHAEARLALMQRMYDKARAVDKALTPVWQEMHDAESDTIMPEQPPIYWNQNGFYLTEDEALLAYRQERDARREEQQAKTLEGISSILTQMLEAQGFAS
ncbi:hypothetical protein [Vreelandella massiliensis]|uniref:hypothetical protein n=1 Tax=Vreelandella massiliensis TaxID=1816686 RepID=UPI00096A9D5F|nr:hypothetical protein [Halomonas massiliensis]